MLSADCLAQGVEFGLYFFEFLLGDCFGSFGVDELEEEGFFGGGGVVLGCEDVFQTETAGAFVE